MNTYKEQAIDYLKKAQAELEKMDPRAESSLGPEMSEPGRAYEALTGVLEALDWLDHE